MMLYTFQILPLVVARSNEIPVINGKYAIFEVNSVQCLCMRMAFICFIMLTKHFCYVIPQCEYNTLVVTIFKNVF